MARRALPKRIARFIIGEAGEAKLRLMVEISRKLSTATELDEVLNFILDSAGEVIDYNAGGVFLHDPEHETARYVAGRGYPFVKGLEIPLKNNAGIVGWVTATGESVITAEVKENPYY